MSDNGLGPAMRHILVALDASPHSLAALEAAAELAVGLKADLLGLFVEDINLLRLAELPFAREMEGSSTPWHQLDTPDVERELRARASRARRALAMIAGRAQVPWSFRVVHGVIVSELLAAASEADLVILGKVGWSLTGHRHLGSTARAILSQATCLTLILQQGARLSLPILVVYDGSALAQKALAAASRLVRGKNGYLTVLILADEPDAAWELQTNVAKWLRERELEARYRWLIGADVRHLPRIVDAEGCGILVLPGQRSRVQSEGLLVWLDEVTCPALLVR
jgi:nucleotide-binding universal stress UspA family protein